jgi:DNA-binding Lrp family transcriptional regulator
MTRQAILKQTADAWRSTGAKSYTDLAAALGIHRTTAMRRLHEAAAAGLFERNNAELILPAREIALPEPAYGQPANDEFLSVPAMPLPDIPVEEIIAQRIREFDQKRAHEEANKLIPVTVKVPGPLGIWWFGDPHLDDDGTDIGAAFRHAELTRKYPWLFGANIGDTTNNWVGRIAHLYSQQNMGKSRALAVAEHWIKMVKWLLFIDGNHDTWSGDDNPLAFMMRRSAGVHRPDGARINLILPGDVAPVRVHARHDFKGHSMWNPGHGPMKAHQIGTRDHIKISGHKHESFETTLKDPETGEACHIIKVASYKSHDRYAKQLGLGDQALSPGCLTAIRPELDPKHPDRIKVFWDAEEGVDYISYARQKVGFPV